METLFTVRSISFSLVIVGFLFWNNSNAFVGIEVETFNNLQPKEKKKSAEKPMESFRLTEFFIEEGTVKCPDAQVGDVDLIEGVEFEAVNRALLIQRIEEGADLTCLCTSLVTDMSELFFENDSINQEIGNWDVSNVTDMSYMFYGAESFNQDISLWNVSNVVDMEGMFGESGFNQPIGDWNVESVTNLSLMFFGAAAFNQDISGWNVANVTDMSYMFFGAASFDQEIGNWDVSNVVNMEGMLGSASAFNRNITNWDVSSVTNMAYLFFDNSSFNQDISSWNVSNVENMEGIFANAESFNQNLGSWDVSRVNSMSFMFLGASSFNQDISSWNVVNVTNFSYMFFDASSFNQNINSWQMGAAQNIEGMFAAASAFNQALDNWVFPNVSSLSYFFLDATSFNQDLSAWNLENVTNMEGMFFNADSFNQDISNWNVSNVDDMSFMFFGAENFNQDLGNWTVSNVRSFEGMFAETASFNQNLEDWDFSSAEDLSFMFENALAFDQNLGNWNISNVATLEGMLDNSSLSTSNYDATLAGWAAQDNIPLGVVFGAEGLEYCEEEGRSQLIENAAWIITGDIPQQFRVNLEELLIELDEDGNAVLRVEDFENALASNCSISEVSLSRTDFSCGDIGEGILTFTALDKNGETVSAEVPYTVADNLPPVVRAKSIDIQLNTEGVATISPDDIDDGSTDNCGIVSRSLSRATFNITNAGDNVVTYTVTDANGNSSSIDIIVRVDIVLSSRNPEIGAGKVKLYPNPAKERLNVSLGDIAIENLVSLQVIDMQGRVLQSIERFSEGTNQLMLDTYTLNPGTYLLRLNAIGKVEVYKFQIAK